MMLLLTLNETELLNLKVRVCYVVVVLFLWATETI